VNCPKGVSEQLLAGKGRVVVSDTAISLASWPECSGRRFPRWAGHQSTLPEANRSSIVSVPLGDAEPTHLLAEMKRRGVVCSARDGNLRLAVHLYNHKDDIDQITSALSQVSS